MQSNIDTIFVDMDGTLVDTDISNTYAYNFAVKEILGINILNEFSIDSRITFNTIKNLLPQLEERIYQEIRELKNNNYKDFLYLTKINPIVFAEVNANSDKTMVLVSKANHKRVVETLKFHDLLDYFDYFFCSNNKKGKHTYNKYYDALTGLNIAPQNVAIYENEEQEILNALSVNIPKANITKIGV